MRTALKLAIVLIATVAMSWCGLFVYWHLRIGRAVRELQQGDSRARGVLHDAGCRALPHLVGAAKPSERLTFLAATTSLILTYLYERPAASITEYTARTPEHQLLESLQIEALDTADVRAAKCRELQEWWRANGSKYHQSWRIWSRHCR